jgi:hypothetical protein
LPKVEKEHGAICLLEATIEMIYCLNIKPLSDLSVSRVLLHNSIFNLNPNN